MRSERRILASRRFAMFAVALICIAVVDACAQKDTADRVTSSASVSRSSSEVVGGGGHMDEVYRAIYTPGRGTDW
jgi:hypothetical protein